MRNEILLIGSLFVIYSMVLLAYRMFGKVGLYVMTVIATILANIEVLMIVEGFGIEQTLGNVMFASTYLVTDILSENEGRKSASKAVWLGAFSSIAMVILTQYWLLYSLSPADWAGEYIREIFSTTPRLILASFLGYVVSQRFDVWLYHRWWSITEKKTGNKRSFLWVRNNASTLVSQIVNTVVFTTLAFAGWYDAKTFIMIMLSSYLIYIFTSIIDTPVIYLARHMKEKGLIPAEAKAEQ